MTFNTQFNTQELWGGVLKKLKNTISETSFDTWFADTHALRIENENTFVLGVPNEFIKSYIQRKYLTIVTAEVSNMVPGVRKVKLTISRKGTKNKPKGRNYPSPGNTIPLSLEGVNRDTNLNNRFTFDELVVAPYIQFAHGAASAVTKKPGITYNPLFIWGKTGVGKTHLIQAIGNQIFKENSNMRVKYIQSETYVQEFACAVTNNEKGDSVNVFRKKYKNYDVLIMDDVHFFSNKEASMAELFLLFNHFYNNNKQIIFSSDRPPAEIQQIEDRIRTRFQSGIVMDISDPNEESLCIVLKEKARRSGIDLEDGLVNYIISHINNNIRDVEGVLKGIHLHQDINKKLVDMTNVRQVIRHHLKQEKTRINDGDVIRRVCEYYDIPPTSITSSSRKRELVEVRQIIMFVLREYFDKSYTAIGEKLGKRDHTTVMHAYEKVNKAIQDDMRIQRDMENIKKALEI